MKRNWITVPTAAPRGFYWVDLPMTGDWRMNDHCMVVRKESDGSKEFDGSKSSNNGRIAGRARDTLLLPAESFQKGDKWRKFDLADMAVRAFGMSGEGPWVIPFFPAGWPRHIRYITWKKHPSERGKKYPPNRLPIGYARVVGVTPKTYELTDGHSLRRELNDDRYKVGDLLVRMREESEWVTKAEYLEAIKDHLFPEFHADWGAYVHEDTMRFTVAPLPYWAVVPFGKPIGMDSRILEEEEMILMAIGDPYFKKMPHSKETPERFYTWDQNRVNKVYLESWRKIQETFKGV